eukprot:scaffold7963_cov116-Isochrysis_galbana.AAC.22
MAVSTTSSASSTGSRPVIRPTPLAADQRTTVSASRRPLSSCCKMPSTASGTRVSSSSAAGAGRPVDAASEPTSSPADPSMLCRSDRAPRV